MKTFRTRVQIDKAGKVRLEVPSGLPPGPAEVVLVIQPEGAKPEPRQVRSGIFDGKSIDGIDLDVALEEINAQWKAKLGLNE